MTTYTVQRPDGYSGPPYGSFASKPVNLQPRITETTILMLPVNAVMAGQQPEEKIRKYTTDFAGILKKIFGE